MKKDMCLARTPINMARSMTNSNPGIANRDLLAGVAQTVSLQRWMAMLTTPEVALDLTQRKLTVCATFGEWQ